VDEEPEQAARRLAEQPEVAAAADRLTVPAIGPALAVGDSVTVYRRSYFELLRRPAGLRHPDDRVRFANHAQSGYTTTHARRSTYRQYPLERPDLVFILLGGNDCERFATGDRLVSVAEYQANVEAMVEAFRSGGSTRVVLISPAPAIRELWSKVPDHRRLQLSWEDGDLRACVEALKGLAFRLNLPFVDLIEAFGLRPDPALQFVDGLHPGQRGQELILEHVLAVLST
jgi:lysophospholipase L1-like esterase